MSLTISNFSVGFVHDSLRKNLRNMSLHISPGSFAIEVISEDIEESYVSLECTLLGSGSPSVTVKIPFLNSGLTAPGGQLTYSWSCDLQDILKQHTPFKESFNPDVSDDDGLIWVADMGDVAISPTLTLSGTNVGAPVSATSNSLTASYTSAYSGYKPFFYKRKSSIIRGSGVSYKVTR